MKTIVIFSGAGLSKESGIATFRDSKDGLWNNYRIEEVASREGWIRSPQTVLRFYEARWKNVISSEPNAAHRAIASLDHAFHVINITQNIDDLLERAGARHVTHLHGQITFRKCEWHRSIVGASGLPEFQCDYRAAHQAPVRWGETCPRCGGQLRPDVVWFGEAVDMRWDDLHALAKKTDLFLGIGTSGQVEPAASLLSVFRTARERYFIDPEPPRGLSGYQRIQGTACEHMPALAKDWIARLNRGTESG